MSDSALAKRIAARARNDRRSRGYGTPHMRRRRQLALLVASGTVECARCGRLIEPGEKWDLGHADGSGKARYSGPEHSRCNRSAGGRASHELEPKVERESRRW